MANLKLRLIAWPDFKKLIFDIMDHRIENAPEIHGLVNTTYMSMDEHLVIYMIDQFAKDPGPLSKKHAEHKGTRKEVERKLIEFLYALKYYSGRWMRAKLYAEMLGFLHTKESMSMFWEYNKVLATGEGYSRQVESLLDAAAGVNDGTFEDVQIPAHDIFTQDFFFYAYSVVAKDSRSFMDSPQGYTYVKQLTEQRQTLKVMGFLYGDLPRDSEKWTKKIKSQITKVRENKLDENETDFIDVDLVLSYYLEEYRNLRRLNMQRIAKAIGETNRRNAHKNAKVGVKDILEMMETIVPGKTSIPTVTFARNMTFIRAFVYALVCENNSDEISLPSFLAACNRFGIDSPCPIVSKRLSTFGNAEELEKEFKRLVDKF